jgi:hypothetical protein
LTSGNHQPVPLLIQLSLSHTHYFIWSMCPYRKCADIRGTDQVRPQKNLSRCHGKPLLTSGITSGAGQVICSSGVPLQVRSSAGQVVHWPAGRLSPTSSNESLLSRKKGVNVPPEVPHTHTEAVLPHNQTFSASLLSWKKDVLVQYSIPHTHTEREGRGETTSAFSCRSTCAW